VQLLECWIRMECVWFERILVMDSESDISYSTAELELLTPIQYMNWEGQQYFKLQILL
jgi:hypothetical protein